MKLKALLLPVTAALLLTLGTPVSADCPTEGCPAQTFGTIELPAGQASRARGPVTSRRRPA